MNPSTLPAADHLDWATLPIDSIDLSPEQVSQAMRTAQGIPTPDRQWSTYLQALALRGVEQWLSDRAPDLAYGDQQCSVNQPAYANLIDAACNLEIGGFRVCLVTVGSLTDEVVAVPKAVLDLPDFVAHLYVLVEVLEEQEQVQIQGYFRHDQWSQHRQDWATADPDAWAYNLPRHWFTQDADALLGDLRLLAPAAIALPTIAPQPYAPFAALKARLRQCLPSLENGAIALEDCLTWAEAATLLTHPDLVQWLYQVQQSGQPTEFNPLQSLQSLRQRVINVGQWLRSQVDQVAEEMAWVLMPAPALEPMRRTASDRLQSVTAELSRQGMPIPADTRIAYRDLRWGGVTLRLHALVWQLPDATPTPEWAMLVIVGALPGATPPAGLKLMVRDAATVLAEQELTQPDPDAYLYAQVIGAADEQFWVTIDLGNGAVVTLPPFALEQPTH
ncbi:MAG: DUF1822 family protein, partial [Synechococcales bacterium]|nr:DUF1822 family protein [Synechococcales bacterium]